MKVTIIAAATSALLLLNAAEGVQIRTVKNRRQMKNRQRRSRRHYSQRRDVTKGFCQQVLKDVEAEKAPYWLEGKLTDEVREELSGSCDKLVCNWSEKYQSFAEEEESKCEEGESKLFKILKECEESDDCKTPSFMIKVHKKE